VSSRASLRRPRRPTSLPRQSDPAKVRPNPNDLSSSVFSFAHEPSSTSSRDDEGGPQEEAAHHHGAIGSAKLLAFEQVGRGNVEPGDANAQFVGSSSSAL